MYIFIELFKKNKEANMNKSNPANLLKLTAKAWPNVWENMKRFRANKGVLLPDWPDWCYLPVAAGVEITRKGKALEVKERDLEEKTKHPYVVTAAAAWRITKGVYRFDPDLYNELVSQPMDQSIPADVLKRLPEWCVYIETPNMRFLQNPVLGFWAFLDYNEVLNTVELFFLLEMPNGEYFPIFAGYGEKTIEESYKNLENMPQDAQTSSVWKDYRDSISAEELEIVRNRFANGITPFIQLTLYLCAENADMIDVPRHPTNRVRMSGQVDVKKDVRVWMVGERIGSSLRKYRNKEILRYLNNEPMGGSHASPRPHVRRAHWHHFWTGSKNPQNQNRKLVLRWLSPIPVNADDNEGPVVTHEVG